MCLVFLHGATARRIRPGPIRVRYLSGLNPCSCVWANAPGPVLLRPVSNVCEVNRGNNSDSLRDAAYHSVWLDQNAARYYPLHEDSRHVVGFNASSPDREAD